MIDSFPDTLAVVTIHHGDAWETSWGDARRGFYDTLFDGYPCFVLDGLAEEGPIGSYLTNFVNRQLVPTDVTMEMSAEFLNGAKWDFTAEICVEPGGTGRDMRIHFVEVLDNYPVTTYSNRNTVRQGAEVVDISVAAGECIPVPASFSFDATSMAQPEDIKIIAWAQDVLAFAPSEIYQGAKIQWPFEPAMFADGFESGDTSAWSTNENRE